LGAVSSCYWQDTGGVKCLISDEKLHNKSGDSVSVLPRNPTFID